MNNIPANLKNINLNRHMRRNKMFDEIRVQKNIYDNARKLAGQVISSRKKPQKVKAVEPARYYSFTNDQADNYWAKQIQIAEVVEQRFAQKIALFLKELENTAVSNLPRVVKAYKKTLPKQKEFQLFNPEDEIKTGIDLFTPLQEEIAELAGMEAYLALNLNTIYTPSKNLKEYIRENVAKFTESFVDTDRKKLEAILEAGLSEGMGVAPLERKIRDEFGDYTKMQAERIARSETIRASNQGALDAFEVSGVVKAKQWYTSQDARVCKICAPLDGKILSLQSNFPYEDNYDSKLAPPAHVSCRCVVLPVIESSKSIQLQHEELLAYTRELEKLAGVSE